MLLFRQIQGGGSNQTGCIRRNGLPCQVGQVCCNNGCLPAGFNCCDQNTGDFCGSDEPVCCGTRCLPADNICCSDMNGTYGCENGTTCTDSNPNCQGRCRPEGQVCTTTPGIYCPTTFSVLCRDPNATPPENRCFASGSECCGAGNNAYACPPSTECCGNGCTPPNGRCCGGGSVCNPFTQAQIDTLIEQGHLPAGTDANDFNPPVCCGMGCCPRGATCGENGQCLPPPDEPII